VTDVIAFKPRASSAPRTTTSLLDTADRWTRLHAIEPFTRRAPPRLRVVDTTAAGVAKSPG
jgi:hypothetical protein